MNSFPGGLRQFTEETFRELERCFARYFRNAMARDVEEAHGGAGFLDFQGDRLPRCKRGGE